MKITDFFDKIYCINLEHRSDRWELALNEFKKIGIENGVIRFNAVYNKENGALGCRDSHLKVIQDAKDNNYERILIFEDDVLFLDNDISLIENTLDQLNEFDYDIFYLGATVAPNIGFFTQESENIVKTNFAYTTHSYSITSKNYDFILKNSINYGIVDVFYNQFIVPLGKSYVANPMLTIQQSDNFSDIEKTKSESYEWMIDFFNQVKTKSNIN
jgi:GR25 family glycosyltransferase involved in LPS biosynthesis